MKKIFNALAKIIASSETFVIEEGRRKAFLKKERFLLAQTISGRYCNSVFVVKTFNDSSLGYFPKAFEAEKENAKAFCRTGQSPK